MNSGLQKQHEEPTFFIDRALGSNKLPARLRSNGFKVEVHDDHFNENTSDIEWLRFVGKKSWYVITKDKRIRYRENEKQLVIEYNIGMFVFTKGKYTSDEMAEIIIKARRNIENFINRTPAPFIASISKSGNITNLEL